MRTEHAPDLVPNSATSAVQELRRLGRNHNGYFGETVEIDRLLCDCRAQATDKGWAVEELGAAPGLSLLTFRRLAGLKSQTPVRVYISAGIHGDEPAGPVALNRLLKEDRWPEDIDLWLCPCLNPTGFVQNKRENACGLDLNRQYLQPQAHEIIAHVAWLERQPRFDLCLCLHEDWESQGFYLYELNPDRQPSVAEAIIKEVSTVCPIDHSRVIDGHPSQDGIIRPKEEIFLRRDWPEAFFLLMHKTRISYTLEAPSDFPLAVRAAGLARAVETALGRWERRSTSSMLAEHRCNQVPTHRSLKSSSVTGCIGKSAS